MRAMQRGKGSHWATYCVAATLPAAGLMLLLLGGCSTSIQTPLPDLGPPSSTALSPEERKKAVEELNAWGPLTSRLPGSRSGRPLRMAVAV